MEEDSKTNTTGTGTNKSVKRLGAIKELKEAESILRSTRYKILNFVTL